MGDLWRRNLGKEILCVVQLAKIGMGLVGFFFLNVFWYQKDIQSTPLPKFIHQRRETKGQEVEEKRPWSPLRLAEDQTCGLPEKQGVPGNWPQNWPECCHLQTVLLRPQWLSTGEAWGSHSDGSLHSSCLAPRNRKDRPVTAGNWSNTQRGRVCIALPRWGNSGLVC